MKPIVCLTQFLRTGKKLKLESGETFDDLRTNKNIDCELISKSEEQRRDQMNEMVGVKVGVISCLK